MLCQKTIHLSELQYTYCMMKAQHNGKCEPKEKFQVNKNLVIEKKRCTINNECGLPEKHFGGCSFKRK